MLAQVLAATGNESLKSLIICLLLVALVALAVWAICTYVAKRPDIGGAGAALVAVIGAILCLLDHV